MFNEAILIDGRYHASRLLEKLKLDINHQKKQNNLVEKLAIILVGSNPASMVYVKNKIATAEKVGIEIIYRNFDDSISENLLLKEIERMNKDPSVSGIIIQLPLPAQISKEKLISTIDPAKDVDGFHPLNVGLLYSGYGNGFIPCTARGCLDLIKFTQTDSQTDLRGKTVAIIGRSNIVGRPLAALLIKENATVTLCHSKTEDLAFITNNSDVVVSAVGNPKFLTAEYFSKKSIVIDVGITRIGIDNKYELSGDVDFHSVKKKVSYITPVPGGVGPMTIAYLLTNSFEAMLKQRKLTKI